MDWTGDRDGARGKWGSGQPMAETAARWRVGSVARQTAARPAAPADLRPAGAAPGALVVGSGSLRVPRRRVDHETGGGGHRAGIWGALSPRSCRTPAPGRRVVGPEARHPR